MHNGLYRGLAPLLPALLALGACQAPDPAPRTLGAIVAPLPTGASAAEALLFLDDEPVGATLRSELRPGELRLEAELPEGARGALHLGVALLDGDGCVVGIGAAQADAADEGLLWVLPERTARTCRKERPLLLAATPDALALETTATVTLSGWGFRPGAAVRLGGAPAKVRWRSPLQLEAEGALPAGAGPVAIEVENPGGGADRRADLLRGFPSQVRLGEPNDYAVGRMSAMTLRDLDGDGAPELLLSLPQRAEVAVLRNRGDGTFAADGAPRYAVGAGAVALAALDLDGDGAVELVTASAAAGELSVLPGRKDGTFGAAWTAPAGGVPAALSAADLDGSGREALIVALSDRDRVRLLRGAAMDRVAEWPVGAGPTAVTVGDLDGDGAPDLVVGNGGSADLSVLVNRGDGTFPAWLSARYATGGAPRFVTLADVNGDGRLDVLTGGGRGGVALLNGGDGAFPPARRIAFGVSVDAQFAAAGDVNGDGLADLAILSQGGGFAAATLLLNRGAGAFEACCSLDSVTSNAVQLLALTDVDRDGQPDLVLATTVNGGHVSVAPNRSR